jgi:hypothetical protein
MTMEKTIDRIRLRLSFIVYFSVILRSNCFVVMSIKTGTSNRVKSFPTPWMATANTAQAEPSPFNKTVMAKSVHGVT